MRPRLRHAVSITALVLPALGASTLPISAGTESDPMAGISKREAIELALPDDQAPPLERLSRAAKQNGAFGVYVNEAGDVVVVMPSGATGFTAADASKLGFAVKTETLNTTVDAIESLRAKTRALWNSRSPRFSYAAYLDIRHGKFVIETEAAAADFAAVIAGNESIVEIRPSDGVQFMLNRFADTAPFRGGAAVFGTGDDGGLYDCTTSYPAKKSGVNVLLTAGHCFKNGSQVKTDQGGAVVGSVTYRDFPNYDAEIIGNKTYSPYVYTGAIGNNGKVDKILGRFVGWIGQQYICMSGIRTGLACNYTFVDNNATFCTLWECVDHMNAYKGEPELQGGDSGGPFFVYYTYQGTTGVLIHATTSLKVCYVIVGCTYGAEPWQGPFGRWSLTQYCWLATCRLPF